MPCRSEKPHRRDAACAGSADAWKKPSYVEDKDSGELRRPTTSISRPDVSRRQVLKPKTEA